MLSADAMLFFDDLSAMVFSNPAAKSADQMAVAVGLIYNFITFLRFGLAAFRHRSNNVGFFKDFQGSVDSRPGNALRPSAQGFDQFLSFEMESGRLLENGIEDYETFVTDIFPVAFEVGGQMI